MYSDDVRAGRMISIPSEQDNSLLHCFQRTKRTPRKWAPGTLYKFLKR
jgi:hypothetical protein